MNKVFDVGCFIGRFQHIHKGHQYAIDCCLKICDRMLILIGSSQEKGTLLNPFDVTTRAKMIEEIYPERVIVRGLPDLTHPEDISAAWGRHVIDNIKQHIKKTPDIFIYGNDQKRSSWFSAQSEEVKEVTEVIIARERTNISATQLREMMFQDDFDSWMKNVDPKLHKFYNELRDELMSTKAYLELAQKLIAKSRTGWTDKPQSIFAES